VGEIVVAVYAAPEGAAKNHSALHAAQDGEEQEVGEVGMVGPANTVINPRAVVVHLLYAAVT